MSTAYRSAIFIVIAIFYCLGVNAQSYPTGFSAPLDLPEKGWNKTLLLSNGNTALVHIEQKKPITIYLFNKEKLLIATKQELSAYIGVANLVETEFKGLYEIGGKLVLFLQQPEDTKISLVRMSYNTMTAALETEAVIGQLPGLYVSDFTVIRCDDSDDYAVIQYQMIVKPMLRDWNIKLMMFDKHHTKTKQKDFLFFDKSREDIDELFVIGAYFTKEHTINVCFSLNRFNNTKHHAVLAFLPSGSDEFVYKVISVSDNAMPASATFAEDSATCKILISVAGAVAYAEGHMAFSAVDMPCVATVDKKTFIVTSLHTYKDIECTAAARIIALANGVAIASECIPFTTPDGSTLGPVTATEIDNDGIIYNRKTIIKIQRIRQMVYSGELANRMSMKTLFTGTNASEYASQFVSIDMRRTKAGYAIIMNTSDENAYGTNFDDHKAQAFCYNFVYPMDPDKRFLFPNATAGANSAVFLESASYDMASDTYAALTSSTVDKKTKLYMSWSKLND